MTKNFNSGVGFLKVFYDVFPELKKVLSKSEFTSMMLILPYISFEDCIVKNEDGTVTTLNDFARILDLSYERTRRRIKSLVNNGVLGKFERWYKETPNKRFRCYVFNPYIATKNRAVNNTVKTMFADSEWLSINEDIRIGNNESLDSQCIQ